jgi:hypothetical protein
MATKPKKKVLNPDFRGFVNINITEDLKKTIKAIEYNDDAFVDQLFKLIDRGYSVKFSFDDYNHCHQAVMTGGTKEHPDYGVFLSGRGSMPAKAFKQMSYLFHEICGGELAPNLIDKPDGEYDD